MLFPIIPSISMSIIRGVATLDLTAHPKLAQEAGKYDAKNYQPDGCNSQRFPLRCRCFARPAAAQAAAQDQQKPAYTIPEYNAFQAAQCGKRSGREDQAAGRFRFEVPELHAVCSTSTSCIFSTYFQMKNYPKTIEVADKLVAMGDKADPAVVLGALQARVQAFSAMQFNPSAPDASEQLTKERDAALQGAKMLEAFPKPADQKMSDEDFAKQKKPGIAFFNSAAGAAALQIEGLSRRSECLQGRARRTSPMTPYRPTASDSPISR